MKSFVEVQIKKIEQIAPQDKYDLEVEDNENFFANGILVHNCRCIANRDGLWSRTGKEIVACPHINQALQPLFASNPDMVLDGELYNHDFKDDFNSIISMVRKTKPAAEDLAESADKVQYHVYDIASETTVFESRKDSVAAAVAEVNHPAIVCVETLVAHDEAEVDNYFGEHVALGYEGGIIRINDVYEQKRTKSLLKRKDFEDAEFEIIRIEEGKGNWRSFAKSLIIRLPDGSTQQSGLAGTQEYLKQVLVEKDDYEGGEATVCYFQKTLDGKLRFPVAKVLFKKKRDV